jgi:phosphoribosylglycinamide formyltransferase-1
MRDAATPRSDSDKQARPPRLAVALSGGGTTLINLHRRIADGQLHAEIACVIASNDHCKGIQRAQDLRLPDGSIHVLPRKSYADKHAFSAAVFDACRSARVDLLILAGFLSLLVIPEDFADRVLNIHPSLLPKFGGKGMHGMHVHQAVIEAGESVTGCTVHVADNTYDTGPIVLQKTCPVLSSDTLEALARRVFELECDAYPDAIASHWRMLSNA